MWATLNQPNDESFYATGSWTKVIGDKQNGIRNGGLQPMVCYHENNWWQLLRANQEQLPRQSSPELHQCTRKKTWVQG
jgi:hypothetical protein